MTVDKYCRQNSINTKTFYYWKKKYARQVPKAFTPLTVVKGERTKSIAIHYSGGTRLIFEDGTGSSVIKEFLPVYSK